MNKLDKAPKQDYIHYKQSCIYQYSLDGEFIAQYSSCQEAGKKCYIYPRSIEKCCRGEVRYSGDFQWRRVPTNFPTTPIEPVIIKIASNKKTPVIQMDKEGNYIATYNSISEAARKIGVDIKAIRQTIKGRQTFAGGYRWKQKAD